MSTEASVKSTGQQRVHFADEVSLDAKLALELQREEFLSTPSPPKRRRDSGREDEGGSPSKLLKSAEKAKKSMAQLRLEVAQERAETERLLSSLQQSDSAFASEIDYLCLDSEED